MPGGAGKARRACQLCKPYKRAGNGKGWDTRRSAHEIARAPGNTRSERSRLARDMADD